MSYFGLMLVITLGVKNPHKAIAATGNDNLSLCAIDSRYKFSAGVSDGALASGHLLNNFVI